MTAAEFRTLREACGLSQQAAANFFIPRVHLTSVQGWESGRSRVPAGVADDLRRLDALLERAVLEMLDAWRDLAARHGEPDAVALLRWRTPAAYAATHHAAEGLPHGTHGALVTRAATALRRAGATVQIGYAEDAA